MISRRCHGHGKTLKDSFVIVHHRAGLAMHEMRGASHAAAEGFPDRLVSQTDPEHGNFSCEVADQIDADARLMRRARPGRDYDPLGVHFLDLAHRDLIVTTDFHLGARLPDVLDQVVGEGIVIVEYENQGVWLPISAYTEETIIDADCKDADCTMPKFRSCGLLTICIPHSEFSIGRCGSPLNGPASHPTVVLTVILFRVILFFDHCRPY